MFFKARGLKKSRRVAPDFPFLKQAMLREDIWCPMAKPLPNLKGIYQCADFLLPVHACLSDGNDVSEVFSPVFEILYLILTVREMIVVSKCVVIKLHSE